MPDSYPAEPPEDTVFSLLPQNKEAIQVVNHPDNGYLAWKKDRNSTLALAIQSPSDGHGVLARLGRGTDVDVTIQGSAISKLQCSFEMRHDTNAVMLYDRSSSQTTHVIGPDSIGFEHGRPRRVVLLNKVNTLIAIGSLTGTYICFKLKWHRESKKMLEGVANQAPRTLRQQNPRQARTIDDSDNSDLSRYPTRIHTPLPGHARIRYKTVAQLGTGSFGTVEKVVDMDTGSLMAVKKVPLPPIGSSNKQYLKREIEALASCKHENIVNYIAYQDFQHEPVEIFMGLMEGTLHSLIQRHENSLNLGKISDLVLFHMLKALDFLSIKSIIHRDVKPENILFTTLPSAEEPYQFRLGDFGLCNVAANARTFLGSPPYIAPEVREKGVLQTSKVDIWSLFVTIIWTLDVHGYRSNGYQQEERNFQAIVKASTHYELDGIQEMASINPETRPSAAQMLLKLWGGKGLSTAKSKIPEETARQSSAAARTAKPYALRRPPNQGPSRVNKRGSPRATKEYPREKHPAALSASALKALGLGDDNYEVSR